MFHSGAIDGVIWKPLRTYHDERGWLCELFRHDELPAEYHPVMAYISMTAPGVARGPHEHADQADCFCFLGPSNFKVYLWDNRPSSATYRAYQTEIVGGLFDGVGLGLDIIVGAVCSRRSRRRADNRGLDPISERQERFKGRLDDPASVLVVARGLERMVRRVRKGIRPPSLGDVLVQPVDQSD